MVLLRRLGHEEPAGSEELLTAVRSFSGPLASAKDLNPLLDAIGDARYVLLGEASHGTANYYTWRARISQRLIREKGFSFIAVEGDWPDCYRINRQVKGLPDAGKTAHEALHAFERWPTSMWANAEIMTLSTASPRPLSSEYREEGLPAELFAPRGHRAIGVVYHPEYEQYGNYVPTVLPRRYDAFLYLDATTALHPLHDVKPRPAEELPETFPSGA